MPNVTKFLDFPGLRYYHNKLKESLLQEYQGATSSSDGTSGLVPAPQTTDREKFLRGDGTWAPAASEIGESTLAELEAGESTEAKTASPKILHDYVASKTDGLVTDVELVKRTSMNVGFMVLDNKQFSLHYPRTSSDFSETVRYYYSMGMRFKDYTFPFDGTTVVELATLASLPETFQLILAFIVNPEETQDHLKYAPAMSESTELTDVDAAIQANGRYTVVLPFNNSGIRRADGYFEITKPEDSYVVKARLEFGETIQNVIDQTTEYADGSTKESVVVLTDVIPAKHTHSFEDLNIDVYQGATENANGIAGLVPSALSEERNNFLKGDGTWSSANTDISLDITPKSTQVSSEPYSSEAIEYNGTLDFGAKMQLDGTYILGGEYLTQARQNDVDEIQSFPVTISSESIKDDSTITLEFHISQGSDDFWATYTLEDNFTNLLEAGSTGLPMTEDSTETYDGFKLLESEGKSLYVSCVDNEDGTYTFYPFIGTEENIPEQINLVVEHSDGTNSNVDLSPLASKFVHSLDVTTTQAQTVDSLVVTSTEMSFLTQESYESLDERGYSDWWAPFGEDNYFISNNSDSFTTQVQSNVPYAVALMGYIEDSSGTGSEEWSNHTWCRFEASKEPYNEGGSSWPYGPAVLMSDLLAAGEKGLPLYEQENLYTSTNVYAEQGKTIYLSCVANQDGSYTFSYTTRKESESIESIQLDGKNVNGESITSVDLTSLTRANSDFDSVLNASSPTIYITNYYEQTNAGSLDGNWGWSQPIKLDETDISYIDSENQIAYINDFSEEHPIKVGTFKINGPNYNYFRFDIAVCQSEDDIKNFMGYDSPCCSLYYDNGTYSFNGYGTSYQFVYHEEADKGTLTNCTSFQGNDEYCIPWYLEDAKFTIKFKLLLTYKNRNDTFRQYDLYVYYYPKTFVQKPALTFKYTNIDKTIFSGQLATKDDIFKIKSYINNLIYIGATSTSNVSSYGIPGLVPAATYDQTECFLKGDGTWAEITLPSTLTATEVQTGTDTAGKLISAKVLHDYVESSNTDTKVNVTLGTTTKAYLLGTSTTPTSTASGVTAISDTGVYLDTTAGRLTATSFAGNVENGTLATANAVVVTNASKKLTASTTITTTELGYLDGVTSSIQTQLNGKAASSHNHDASNITSGTLDAARLPSIDASKITSGTIDIARLPAGALERLVTVADQTARFALSSSDVQLGDTVRQSDTGLMYYVVDTSKLNSEAGYAEYTAGSATSVPWSGITSKPSTYAPSAHNQASNTINAMTGYSKPSSTSAIGTSDTLNAAIGKLEKALDGKANSNHNHASSEVTTMTSYSKPSSTSAIATTDSLNTAIGKLEKALDGKAASSHGTHVTYSTSNPLVAGTASAGTANNVSRGDHVHPEQTTVKQTKGVFLVIPTQTSQTATLTATVDGITEYFPGLTIAYRAPFNTAASSTLNINGLGAKPIYYKVNTTSKDYYPANTLVLLVYETTTASGGCWKMVYSYDGNNNNYDRRLHNQAVKAAAAVTSGTVIVGTSAGYKTAASGVTFDISYPILYAAEAIAANATNAKTYEAIPSVNLQTTKASWTGTQYATAYLVGTLSGTTFTIDSSIFTTTVPSTADGKVYIPLGVLYSTYQVYFAPTRDIYQYTNGSFHPLDTTTAATGSSNGTIKINGTDVAVKGINTAAYKADTYFAQASHGTHVSYSSDAPAAVGTASAGSASTVARSDHVHSLPDSGVTANTYGNTAQQTPSHGGTFNIPYVTVDAKGIVTGAGTTTVKLPADNNTDTKVNVTLGTTTKAYLLGTSTTPTSTVTAVTSIADTGVYLDTTAGRLTAGSFAGDGQNITYGAANAVVVTDANKKLVSHSSVTTTELGYLDGVTSSIQTQLDGKAASSHNQASSTINAMTGYSKPSSTSAIGTSDTLNAAIGKLEKALDGKQASGTYLTPSSTLDATKLSGTIPSECYTDTIYTHPTTAGNKHIPSGGSSGQFLGWSADGTAAWVGNPNWTTHLYAGAASNSTANATSATTNAATYIVVCDNSSARNAVQVTGTNGTTVSAVNGKLTIDSPALASVTNAQIDTLFA